MRRGLQDQSNSSARRLLLTLMIVMVLAINGTAAAIEVREVVHLVDGEVIEGAIVLRIPGESYTIETRRGRSMEVPISQIDWIEKRAVDPADEAFSYRHVVFLNTGVIFRGTIVQEVPDERIVLLADGGLSLSFDMDEIWQIGTEKCASGQSRAAIGEHPSGRDMRRQFRIELTINRIEEEESSEAGTRGSGDPVRLDRLREELSALENERDDDEALREEGEASISRLREQIGELEGESEDLATELAQRAMTCAEGNAEAEAAVLAAYDVVQQQSGELRDTALVRTEVDPRLLAEQVAMERQMRRVELTSLLAPPLPGGRLDPAVASLVPIFDQDERRQIYRELRVPSRARNVIFNMLVPVGLGSYLQGDYLSGLVSSASFIAGAVVLLPALLEFATSESSSMTFDSPLTTPVGRRALTAGAVMVGGYLYGTVAPMIFRTGQNHRLERALHLGEELEVGE